jgi:non-heme Fe2+,alpha-ketoglutarate-dependent halogenase
MSTRLSPAAIERYERDGYYEREPRPEADLDPAMLALHAEISDRQAKILYRGTARTSF